MSYGIHHNPRLSALTPFFIMILIDFMHIETKDMLYKKSIRLLT